MKTTIRIFMPVLFAIFVLQSCFKDKGKYDLVDYNKLTVKATAGPAVILGDTLRITPIISWKYRDRDTMAFDYEWKEADSVIDHDRNLAYVPTKTGYINIFLYITEKATGIVSRQPWQAQVNSPFKAGWLLLVDNGGHTDINYIRRDTKKDASNSTYYEYKYYPQVYSTQYPNSPLPANPIQVLTKAFPDYTKDEVAVFGANDESVFLNGDNLSKKISMRNEFAGSTFPNNAYPVDFSDGFVTNYMLLSDGKIYWKRNSKTMGGIHEGMYMNVPIYFEGGGAHFSNIIDINVDQSSFVYLYDDLNRRFMGLYTTTGTNDYLGGKLSPVNLTTPPAGFVDLNNQSGFSMKYCSDYANGIYFMNILKNDNTGEYLLQTYKLAMQYTSLGVSEQQQEQFAGNGLVSDHTVYCRIKTSSYLFFGERSKLYFYDVNTKRVTLYHDFGTGKIIRITTDASSGELGVAFDNGIFYICSLNNLVLGEADPGQTGILYKSPAMGTIKDLKWKWGSYYEYIFRRYPQ